MVANNPWERGPGVSTGGDASAIKPFTPGKTAGSTRRPSGPSHLAISSSNPEWRLRMAAGGFDYLALPPTLCQDESQFLGLFFFGGWSWGQEQLAVAGALLLPYN